MLARDRISSLPPAACRLRLRVIDGGLVAIADLAVEMQAEFTFDGRRFRRPW
jgi:hypothetical protein